MRKILYFIIFAISILLPLNIIFGQSSYETSEDPITFDLLGTFNKSGSYDINPLDWFRGEGGAKNLYLLMYNQAKEVPKRKALKRVMQTQNLTDIEKEALIKGENIAELYAYQKKYGALKQEELLERFTEVKREFDLEKEIAGLEAEMTGETTATEIFANGDLADSGFDLLDDLEKINLILFGQPTTLFGEAGPGAPAGAQELGIGAREREEEQGRREAQRREEQRRERERPEEHEFSPASCSANQDFNKAVNEFKKQEEEQAKDKGAGGAGPQEGISEAQAIVPEEAGYWERARACDKSKIFCLQIEPRFKTESSYQVAENCIACHIEKINDAYRKTVSRGLIPAKATGNLIEMPRCKAGFALEDFANLNIVAIPNPILTPANDDIVIKNDFLKEIVDFAKKYYGTPEYQIGTTLNPVGLAEKRALQNLAEAEITKVVADINKEVSANRAEAFEVLQKYKNLSRSRSYATYYQALAAEMDQMSVYFNTFKELFRMAETPCTALFDKSTCS